MTVAEDQAPTTGTASAELRDRPTIARRGESTSGAVGREGAAAVVVRSSQAYVASTNDVRAAGAMPLAGPCSTRRQVPNTWER